MRFANLKIGTRLGAGIAVILTLMAIMGGTGFWGLSQADNALHTMESRLMRVSLAKEWEGILTTHAEMVGRTLVTQNPDVVRRLRNDMQAQTRRALELHKELTESSRSPEGHRMIAAINDAAGKFRAIRDEALAIKERNNPAELSKLDTIDNSLTAAMATYIKAVTDYGSRVEAQAAEAAKRAQSTYVLSTRLLLAAGILALLLGIMIGWLVTRSIVRPIGEAVAVARTVASGDLTQRITPKNKDETGQLLAALRDMNDSLALTVGGIRTGFETISVVSAQIAAGNQDLSSRTEEQASSLEETAASMEELASTVNQNAENARQANELAASASDVAERGGSAVSEVVGTMNAISDSSHKISEIVSVIDGIAFQTNILALNAAVEAARAGEQGKGFAVVAGEVRTLAQRSANAAKEIKGLIEDSVSKVSIGAQQVERAGATMQEIVTSVKRVTDIMGEISTASEEQARGIEQVNQAVSQMDAVTQQNAALVEESAAASIAMQDQAGELVRSVSTFKLNSVPQTIDVTATIKKTSQTKPASKTKHTPAKTAKPVVAKAAPRLEHKAKKQETTTDVGDEWTSF